ncbi:MAG: DUF4375 domain-containing protein, partial [Planctomycetes bacterium]|nr:DUF4375 domain-containing protein [Planctomycetota bacterium]
MVAPRTVSRKQLEAEPYIVWNEFVGILAMSEYDDLTEIQRTAHLCFWYDSELQNGGHLQYFENQGDTRVEEVIRSLKLLRGAAQADVLLRAAVRFRSKRRKRIENAEDYVEKALEDEFDSLDSDYYRCRPEVGELLENYLAEHRDEF